MPLREDGKEMKPVPNTPKVESPKDDEIIAGVDFGYSKDYSILPDEVRDKIDNLLADLIYDVYGQESTTTILRLKQNAKAQLVALIKLQQEALHAEYDEIFKWLLGESGDFPQSVKGARYNWRPELRNRLNKLRLEL